VLFFDEKKKNSSKLKNKNLCMKKIFLSFLLGGMLITVFSDCNLTSGPPPPLISYYLIHASPDAPALDFFVNGNLITDNLLYGRDTGYFETEPGIFQLQVKKTGESD